MDKPEGVGDDWIELPCQNPACNRMAWVPPDMVPLADVRRETPVNIVCSADCAIALTGLLSS